MKKKAENQKKAISTPPEEVTKPSFAVHTFNCDKWFPTIVALIGLLLYINTINHGYVLDDDTVMAKNSIVTKGIKAIPEIMTTAYRKGAWARQESLYRPLSLVMYAAEWQIAPNNPFIGHLMNILLYALTGFVLYKLLRKWFKEKHAFIAFCISLLFITHPLHTEVIANIKSRDEILGLLFSILSLSAFYDFSFDIKIKSCALGTFYFFLALLSKESTITLVAVIPLSLYFFTKETEKKKYLFTMASLITVVVLYFLLRKIALGGLVNFAKVEILNNSIVATDNPVERFATAIIIVGYYIKLFFFPHPLSFDYSFNTIPNGSLIDYRFILTAIILISLIVYAIKKFKSKNDIAFGILFFGLTLSIVSNIFILIEATLAERFMYLPSLGLCIAVILVLEKLSKLTIQDNQHLRSILNKNKVFSLITGIILVLFSIKTIIRNADWKSNLTLFSTDKDHSPDSYRTLIAYPLELYNVQILPLKDDDPKKQILCTEAIEYLNKGLAIIPDNFRAWDLLAYCYSIKKDNANVQAAFENGIKYYKDGPDLIQFHIMGSTAYFNMGNITRAIEIAKAGLKVDSNSAVLWNTLGTCLNEINDKSSALIALNKSLALDSTNADAYYNLGNIYAKNGDYQTAINNYTKALKVNAGYTQALNNLGNCYAVLKQYDKALIYFEKILNIKPNNKDAIKNISVIYTNQGNTAKAQEYEAKLQTLP